MINREGSSLIEPGKSAEDRKSFTGQRLSGRLTSHIRWTTVWDQKHWAITFPSRGEVGKRKVDAAILFKNHPDDARLVANFLCRQWLEQPGVTMSLDEAYKKWKAIQSDQAT